MWHVLPREARCYGQVFCDECLAEIGSSEAYYRCDRCAHNLCVDCSHEQLGMPTPKERKPPVEILPGDMFFCGPDKFGIHHVILSRGTLSKEDDLAVELDIEPGTELWSCPTIEATQGSHDENTWWYHATTYFTRDLEGAVHLVADRPDEDQDLLFVAEEPVSFKVLLHPLRSEFGNPELDYDIFQSVIEDGASESKRYGKMTAVKAWIANQKGPGLVAKSGVLNPDRYPDLESRQRLLSAVQKSWGEAPICSSVAIKTWQKYFAASSDAPDEVAQNIIDWMPCLCHRTLPSVLVKTLSSCGWILRSTLDALDQTPARSVHAVAPNAQSLPILLGVGLANQHAYKV